MATCKDCFHFEVCDSGRHIGEYELDDGVYSEGVENECLTFKSTSAVVEVVRCKDCKHLKVFNGPTIYAFCPKIDFAFEPFQTDTRTHFCSYGERKEGVDDAD